MSRKIEHNNLGINPDNTYATYDKINWWYAYILLYLDNTHTLVTHEREGE